MTDARGFSVDDIRPDRLMQDLQKVPDIAAKRRQLLARQGEFVTVPCPACGERAAAPEFTKGGFPYVRCAGCDLVYNNPRPDQAMLAEYYRDNPLYAFWNEKIFLQTEPARLEKIFRPRVDRVLELCRENGIAGGTLLEVGAGYGTFCVEMKARGFFERGGGRRAHRGPGRDLPPARAGDGGIDLRRRGSRGFECPDSWSPSRFWSTCSPRGISWLSPRGPW